VIRFASLGSGSRGNGLVVESAGTRIMIDCGFGPREVAPRLTRLGLDPEAIDALLVTHEHSDHVSGAFKFSARYRARLYLTHGTFAASANLREQAAQVEVIDSHAAFSIGALEIRPFPVPHDAREPVQFVIGDGNSRLGVLSDLGAPTAHVRDMLSGCDALVLECNHDREMLARGDYPASLKARIAGPYGHLDNEAAAALLGSLDTSSLQHLIAAHLSEQNNRPELACAALARVLGCAPDWIEAATQEQGFDWRELR
jgi:phosphoribosyl 1,2-cyclic phosphodiesterase